MLSVKSWWLWGGAIKVLLLLRLIFLHVLTKLHLLCLFTFKLIGLAFFFCFIISHLEGSCEIWNQFAKWQIYGMCPTNEIAPSLRAIVVSGGSGEREVWISSCIHVTTLARLRHLKVMTCEYDMEVKKKKTNCSGFEFQKISSK